MKRSDAVKKIKSIIATRGPTQPTIETAEQVLDMLEKEVGMLAPYSPDNLDHGSIQDCQWMPEETICEIPEYAFKCNNCTCED